MQRATPPPAGVAPRFGRMAFRSSGQHHLSPEPRQNVITEPRRLQGHEPLLTACSCVCNNWFLDWSGSLFACRCGAGWVREFVDRGSDARVAQGGTCGRYRKRDLAAASEWSRREELPDDRRQERWIGAVGEVGVAFEDPDLGAWNRRGRLVGELDDHRRGLVAGEEQRLRTGPGERAVASGPALFGSGIRGAPSVPRRAAPATVAPTAARRSAPR